LNPGLCSDSKFTSFGCTTQYSGNATTCLAAFGTLIEYDFDPIQTFKYVMNGITLTYDGETLSMKGPSNSKARV
jgi:hypothetical protein